MDDGSEVVVWAKAAKEKQIAHKKFAIVKMQWELATALPINLSFKGASPLD